MMSRFSAQHKKSMIQTGKFWKKLLPFLFVLLAFLIILGKLVDSIEADWEANPIDVAGYLQRVFDRTPAEGSLTIEPGRYTIERPLLFTNKPVHLYLNGVTLIYKGQGAGLIIGQTDGKLQTCSRGSLEGLCCGGDHLSVGLKIVNCSHWTFDRLRLTSHAIGLQIMGENGYSYFNTFRNLAFIDNRQNLVLGPECNCNQFMGGDFSLGDQDGAVNVSAEGASYNAFYSPVLQTKFVNCVWFDFRKRTDRNFVIWPYFESPQGSPAAITFINDPSCHGNTISSPSDVNVKWNDSGKRNNLILAPRP